MDGLKLKARGRELQSLSLSQSAVHPFLAQRGLKIKDLLARLCRLKEIEEETTSSVKCQIRESSLLAESARHLLALLRA